MLPEGFPFHQFHYTFITAEKIISECFPGRMLCCRFFWHNKTVGVKFKTCVFHASLPLLWCWVCFLAGLLQYILLLRKYLLLLRHFQGWRIEPAQGYSVWIFFYTKQIEAILCKVSNSTVKSFYFMDTAFHGFTIMETHLLHEDEDFVVIC